jgi:hypothetical protein
MKPLLALVFVLFSLMSLIAVNPDWQSFRLNLSDRDSKISELGLRFNPRR